MAVTEREASIRAMTSQHCRDHGDQRALASRRCDRRASPFQ